MLRVAAHTTYRNMYLNSISSPTSSSSSLLMYWGIYYGLVATVFSTKVRVHNAKMYWRSLLSAFVSLRLCFDIPFVVDYGCCCWCCIYTNVMAFSVPSPRRARSRTECAVTGAPQESVLTSKWYDLFKCTNGTPIPSSNVGYLSMLCTSRNARKREAD